MSSPMALGPPAALARPKLLDRIRQAIRTRHYSRRTEEAYVFWVRRFLAFHGMRHPDEMGSAEVAAFLSDLATRRQVSASTQNQAFSAILFLYRGVLERELTGLETVPRAKRPERVPLVLSRVEVGAVLTRLPGTLRLMAALMYGNGFELTKPAQAMELRSSTQCSADTERGKRAGKPRSRRRQGVASCI